MSKRIPIAGPWITELEERYVAQAVRDDWYESAGTFNRRFEEAFALHCHRKHAVSLPHCTAGIHLALAAAGVSPGDEVIVPDITWIATAAPISYLGATPRFADVDPLTWCLSPASVAERITPRTKAVIAVDLYGGMPEMDALTELCRERGLFFLEDAAEAVGSLYRGRPAGSFGNASVFSFHGSKTLTTGEGGMLTTDDSSLYERILFLRDHGRPPGDRFFQNSEIAYKYKMSSLQAALGLAQLERVSELVEKKRQIFSWYSEGLAELPDIALNVEPEGVSNSYWMTTMVWSNEWHLSKFEIMDELYRNDIETRPFFSQLSSIPAYRGRQEVELDRIENTSASALSEHGINLPSALSLTENDVERVCIAIRKLSIRSTLRHRI